MGSKLVPHYSPSSENLYRNFLLLHNIFHTLLYYNECMVFGIISDIAKTSSLLDNLSEADFNDVSIIMKDEKARNSIASDVGPLKGVHLSTLSVILKNCKIAQSEIQQMLTALQNGQILVAIQIDKNSQQAAVDMITPYQAKHIKIV